MEKSSSRALIFDEKKRTYLVTHNYTNPKNNGKWSTVGGRRETFDATDIDCLRRELTEELGESALDSLRIISKVGEFSTSCELYGIDTVIHHFYYCELLPGKSISPSLNQVELRNGQFFEKEKIKQIADSKMFVLGCEFDLIEKVYASFYN